MKGAAVADDRQGQHPVAPCLPYLPPVAPAILMGPGTVIAGRYEITKLLGKGGMAAVYLAGDRAEPGRLVVLKVGDACPPESAQSQLPGPHPQQESLILAGLNHPGVPRIIDYLTEGRQHVQVLEYFEGGTLDQRYVHQGLLPTEMQLLEWMAQLAEILTYLHTCPIPILHLDIKPGNLAITEADRVILLDFGIARYHSATKGPEVGSKGYAAPEQYFGYTDPRSDIYSVGATLHHLLTGKNPEHEPMFNYAPVRQLNPAISEATEKLVQDCLNRVPERRPESARTLGARLRRIRKQRAN